MNPTSQKNLKPFNLEAALAGEPVITRNGRAVVDFHVFERLVQSSDYPLKGIVLGDGVEISRMQSWTLEGKFYVIDPSRKQVVDDNELDLFMAPKTITVYANLYRKGSNSSEISSSYYEIGFVYSTEQEAQAAAAHNSRFVKTITVTIEL